MTNLDSLFKSRDITLPTKVHLVKAMVFPVVMYGRDSWTTNKAEHRIIDAFELWCWRQLLRVPWTARRSNQPTILKKISYDIHWKDWCWSWNYNNLATWCKEWTHWKRPWCWARLRAGEGNDRGWDDWMASPILWTWVWVSSGSWWWTGKPGVLQSMGLQRIGHEWATELNWWERMPWFFVFWMLSLKLTISLSLLSPSSRGSLVPLHFLPLKWYHLHIWGCWYFSKQSWFQLVSHPARHFAWCTLQ